MVRNFPPSESLACLSIQVGIKQDDSPFGRFLYVKKSAEVMIVISDLSKLPTITRCIARTREDDSPYT